MTDDAPELPPPTAQGTLAKTPLPHLLLYVLERQLTGSLELVAPSGERVSILLIEGLPSKARTSEAVARLGRVLVDQGVLTEEQHVQSLGRFEESDPPRLHGAVLVEMGFIDGAKLLEGLKKQVVLKLEHLFGWPPETQFSYFDSFDALSGYGADDMISIDPLPLVWASIRQGPSWEHVHAAMAKVGTSAMRIAAGAALDRLALTPDERVFADLMAARPRRVHELSSLGTLTPSIKQLLVYCLFITRQIELVADGPAATASAQAANAPNAPEDGPQQTAPESEPQQAAGVPESVPQQAASAPAGGPPPLPTPAQSAAALARVQLRGRQVKVGNVVEERAPGVRRRDRRASSPTMEHLPSATMDAAIAAALKNHASPIGLDIPPPAPPPSAAAPQMAPPPPPPPPPSAPAIPAAAPPDRPMAPPAAEVAALRAKIVERAAGITAEDYFQMLGVARDATKDDVQAAFFALAKTWHPDRLPPQLSDVRDACGTVFSHLSEAHQTLSDPQRRTNYDTLMREGGATPDDQKQITNILEAATNFQKAEICLKRNDLAQAEILCKLAFARDDRQPEYLALLAWLEALKPENQTLAKTEEKIAMLDKAIQMNDKCERAYFYRGMLYKRSQNDRAAYKDFKASAALNPRNIDSVREVRIFNMRRGGKTSSAPPPPPGSPEEPVPSRPSGKMKAPHISGLFGKLFKK